MSTAAKWLEKIVTTAERIPDQPLRDELITIAHQAAEEHLHTVEELRKRLHKMESQGASPTAAVVYRFETLLWTRPSPERVQGPFCPECFESDGELMLLQKQRIPIVEEATVHKESWTCPDCHSEFEVIDRPAPDQLYDQVEAEV